MSKCKILRRKDMKRKLFLLISITLVLVIGLGACSSNNNDDKEKETKEETFNPEPNPDATQVSSYNDEQMEEQAEMDADLLAEYEEDDYTVMNPFVKLDPYDASPLSALVMFDTKETVSVEVKTGTEKYEETITKEWEKGETEHAIPILGLYPGVENKVEITVTNETGNTTTSEITIETDDLPDDFMETTLVDAHKE